MAVSGLRIAQGITGANMRGAGISMTFEPSMAISAAKVDTLGVMIRSFHEPLKRSVQRVMIPSIHKNFVVGGRPKWQPLAEETILKKRYSPGTLGYDSKPLIRSGALMKTMGYLKVWHIDTVRAAITNLPQNVWYGAVHQAGATFGSSTFTIRNPLAHRVVSTVVEEGAGTIPARPFVTVQEEDIIHIEAVFSEWLEERIIASGLAGRRG